MASTYSALKIELLETGANSGTWGTATNVNLGDAVLGEAITGQATVDFATDADVTITLTDSATTQAARNLRLNITESSSGVGSVRNLILGSGCQIEKFYLINNTGTGAKTVKNTSGTGISVPAGKATLVYNNGTNVVDAASYFTSLTLGSALPIASGGTGSTSTTFVNLASNVTGLLPIANGGTATATPALVQGSGVTITGTWPNQTINATGTGGTVTSVAVSGGTTGLTTSGGPITTSGTVTLAGTLATANGGTNLGGATPFTSGGVVYASSSSALATGSALTYNGTSLSIGVSASSPASKLNVSVENVSTLGSPASMGLSIDSNDNNIVVGNLSQIGLGLRNVYQPAYISYIVTSAAGYSNGDLVFGTRSVTTDTAPSERLRIDSAGNVGIGTTSPSSYGGKLTVVGSGGVRSVIANTDTGVQGTVKTFLDFYGTNTATEVKQQATLASAPGVAASSGGCLMLFTNNSSFTSTERLRITEDGAWGLSGSTYGTSGQVLTSGGSAAAPTWTTISSSPTIVRSARTSNTILGTADISTLIDITSGTFTQTFTAAATLGNGWFCYIRNSGTGDITLDPNSSEQIDGLTSYVMYPNECRLVQCTGTAFTSVVLSPFQRIITSTLNPFVTPPGYSTFQGYLWGGGGGGGKTVAGKRTGGGGGGACVPFILTSTQMSSSQVITIAAGGAGATSNGSGSVGGNSTIGSLVTSFGGGGGCGRGAEDATSGGGSGGGALAVGVVGDIGGVYVKGGSPFTGPATSDYFDQNFGGGVGPGGNSIFGGGGGAGNGGIDGGKSVYGGGGGGGVTSSETLMAVGTSSFGGNGGAGGAAVAGTNGVQPAGGGGATHTGANAGNGGAGQCTIFGVA